MQDSANTYPAEWAMMFLASLIAMFAILKMRRH